MESIPCDIFKIIIDYIPFNNNDWLHILLTCKKWKSLMLNILDNKLFKVSVTMCYEMDIFDRQSWKKFIDSKSSVVYKIKPFDQDFICSLDNIDLYRNIIQEEHRYKICKADEIKDYIICRLYNLDHKLYYRYVTITDLNINLKVLYLYKYQDLDTKIIY
jgi:hypothetical protein